MRPSRRSVRRLARRSRPARPRLTIRPQPNDTTCGPTSLHAVYRYYGDRVGLTQLISEVPALEGGGTLGVMLGSHALSRGYRARLYTYNLHVFDPTWFGRSERRLRLKLATQARGDKPRKLRQASAAYLSFLEMGGEILFEDLTPGLLRRHLNAGEPVLTGLSATYLYQEPREIPETCKSDDLRGEPVGHFVVLTDYRPGSRRVRVADPYPANPIGHGPYYEVPMERLVGAIYLGAITYDGNMLVIGPRRKDAS